MEAVLAIAPKETKKNFLRRIWEYDEICAELKAQHDDPIGAKKVLFGKHSALAERRMIEFREAFGTRISSSPAILDAELCAYWNGNVIRLAALRGRQWVDIASVTQAVNGRTRIEIEANAPAILLKRYTPATMPVIQGLRSRRMRRRVGWRPVYTGTTAGWVNSDCRWFPQLPPRHLARTSKNACDLIRNTEAAPASFKNDAIMFVEELSRRTEVFGHVYQRYLGVLSNSSNAFDALVNHGGEFGPSQFNVLLQIASDGTRSGMQVMAATPPASWVGFPDMMYWTTGVGACGTARPMADRKANVTAPGYPKVFTRMSDALSHIVEWCAGTVEIPI